MNIKYTFNKGEEKTMGRTTEVVTEINDKELKRIKALALQMVFSIEEIDTDVRKKARLDYETIKNMLAAIEDFCLKHGCPGKGEATMLSWLNYQLSARKVDGSSYKSGRLEGHADVCAELRSILDPEDENHWNKDGLMREVLSLKRCMDQIVERAKRG